MYPSIGVYIYIYIYIYMLGGLEGQVCQKPGSLGRAYTWLASNCL